MMKTYAIVTFACNDDDDDVWGLEDAIVACSVSW
jgi:hypothetical protein